jgi:tetratricopeptide (TPR) repeat protein
MAVCAFVLFTLVEPCLIRAQCQPAIENAKSVLADKTNSASRTPQYYDQPAFTVAGVVDTTNLGGHGSDTVVRTRESLAKDTVSLSGESGNDSRLLSADKSSALADLERTAQSNQNDFQANYDLALAYAKADRYADSSTKLHTLLDRKDNSAHTQAQLHHTLGDVAEKSGNALEAVREYQIAAELAPSEPYLFDWGTELLAHRAPEAAAEVFAKGNRLFPKSVRMLIGLGVSWHARGVYNRAIACVGEASDLSPNDPNPYLFLGKMMNSETSQPKELVERLERFARLQPENAAANYYYAVALSKRANALTDSASTLQRQSLLEKAIRLDPKFAAAYLQLGILESERKDLPKAIAAFEQAITASPDLEEAHYRLAQAYRLTGEKDKAQQELRLYEELSKKSKEKNERERHEIQQFVILLRNQQSTQQMKQ